MSGSETIAAVIGVGLVIGFIIAEIARVNYERGSHDGYRRGSALRGNRCHCESK